MLSSYREQFLSHETLLDLTKLSIDDVLSIRYAMSQCWWDVHKFPLFSDEERDTFGENLLTAQEKFETSYIETVTIFDIVRDALATDRHFRMLLNHVGIGRGPDVMKKVMPMWNIPDDLETLRTQYQRERVGINAYNGHRYTILAFRGHPSQEKSYLESAQTWFQNALSIMEREFPQTDSEPNNYLDRMAREAEKDNRERCYAKATKLSELYVFSQDIVKPLDLREKLPIRVA